MPFYNDPAMPQELRDQLNRELTTADAVGPTTGVLWVDKNSTSSLEDGTQAAPFHSIQSAVDAALVIEQLSVTIFVATGQYDENIDIDLTGTARRLTFVALGAVSVGVYTNSLVTSSKKVNVLGGPSNEFSFDAAVNFVSLRPKGIAYVSSPMVPGWRLSGGIDFSGLTAGGSSFVVVCGLEAEIGSSDNLTADVIVSSQGNKVVFLDLASCLVHGRISGDNSFVLVSCNQTAFFGNISVYSYQYIHNSWFGNGISFSSVVNPAGGYPQAFTSCFFGTGITFTGPANSLKVDGCTNYFVVNNSVTLGGSASKVLLHSETV